MKFERLTFPRETRELKTASPAGFGPENRRVFTGG
jgi:hypothetical protein